MTRSTFRLQRPLARRPLGMFISALLGASPAWAIDPGALPSGGNIVGGSGTIASGGNQMTVQQQSQQMIVNWDSFNIGANSAVQFVQPSASSVALNRVLSEDASQIFGHLSANGQVFLVNPHGVYFAPGASVNAGSLVASTLDISNEDFASGIYRFTRGQGAAGTISNHGRLEAAEGGNIALIGAKVVNEGEIAARNGTVALAAGDQVTLDFHGDGLLMVNVDKSALAAEVNNRGLISADGGNVMMKASAKDALLESVVNNSGIIRARSIGTRNGVVVLDGGEEGVVMHAGTIDVSGLAAGERGGTAMVLGDKVALTGAARIDARGDAGGGTVLVGGNYQGSGSERHASATFVGEDAVIAVDAIGDGNGGKAVIWADDNTRFYGTIHAKGGARSGDGGEVEVSGKNYLEFQGDVNAGAVAGQAGTLLLDPTDITIVSSGTAAPKTGQVTDGTNGGVLFGDTGAVNASEILNTTINTLLSSGTNVRISTNNAGGSAPNGGTINVNADIVKNAGGEATLRLEADRDINVNASIISTVDKLNVVLNSGRQASGVGSVTINTGAQVITNDGNITIGGGADPTTGSALGGGTTTNGFRMQGGGTSQSTGALLSSGAGNIIINAKGSTASGVTFQTAGYSTILTTTGNITINGGTNSATTGGINMTTGNNTISTLSGNITLNGTAPGSGAGITLGSGGTNVVTSRSGNIVFNGSSSTGTDLNIAPSTGIVRIGTHTGATAGYDLSYTGASSSNITLNGSKLALAPTGSGSAQVKSSGALTIAPKAANATIGIGGGTGTLSLDATMLSALQSGFSSITIGRADGTGVVNIGAVTFADKLLLRGGTTTFAAGNYSFGGGLDVSANGDVTFGTGVVNIATSNSAVRLAATRHIAFNTGASSAASITTSGGEILMNSRSADGAIGYVDLRNASLTSGGGNITIGGGSNPLTGYAVGAATGTTNGVRLGGSVISSEAGNIVINAQGGTAAASGFSMGNSSANTISATSGNITITGNSTDASGINIGSGSSTSGQTISTTTGNISLISTSTSGDAMRLGSTAANTTITVTSDSGNIVLSGMTTGGSGNGLNIGAGTINIESGSGSIAVNGSAGGDGSGISFGPSTSATTTTLRTDSGDVNFNGTSVDGYGINYFASGSASTGDRGTAIVETQSGNIAMTGSSVSNVGFRDNPASTGDTYIRTTDGNIAITGMTSASDVNAVDIRAQSASGREGKSTIQALGSGNIVIAGDRITFDGSRANIIGGGGTLTIRATTPRSTIGFGSGTLGSLSLTDAQIGAIKGSFSAIYVGDPTAGNVSIGASLPPTLPVAPTAVSRNVAGGFSPEDADAIALDASRMGSWEKARFARSEMHSASESDEELASLKIAGRDGCARDTSGSVSSCAKKE